MIKFKSVVRSKQEDGHCLDLGLMQQWVIKSRLLAMTCWCTAGTFWCSRESLLVAQFRVNFAGFLQLAKNAPQNCHMSYCPWCPCFELLGKTDSAHVYLIGTDFTDTQVTNPTRVRKALDCKACNALLLKASQGISASFRFGPVAGKVLQYKCSHCNKFLLQLVRLDEIVPVKNGSVRWTRSVLSLRLWGVKGLRQRPQSHFAQTQWDDLQAIEAANISMSAGWGVMVASSAQGDATETK